LEREVAFRRFPLFRGWQMNRRKLLSKIEPWIVLIAFFTILVIGMAIIMKVEDKYNPSITFREISWALFNLSTVFGFLLFYKKRFPELLSQIKFSCKNFLLGFFLVLVLSLLYDILPYFVVLKEMGPYDFKKISWSIFKWTMPIVIGPITEEIFYCGILLRLFIDSHSLSSAFLLSGLSFALSHFVPMPGESFYIFLLSFLARFFHGILLSAVTYKTKNLSFAFGFHIASNFLAFLTG
jgi:membrane protease YdiL (CAAX protease family)